MADPRVELVRELERTDEAAAATLADLDELARDVDAVRLRGRELDALLAKLPEERSAADAARREAVGGAARARAAVIRAETAVSAAGDEAAKREHRRELVRAGDRLHIARRKADEAVATLRSLEARAVDLDNERDEIERRARALAAVLRRRPRLADDAAGEPAPGLAPAVEWASRARASLFLARGQLAAERDALIRQANELGAAVVGEPLTAASAAVVARRVEWALGACA